MFAHLETRHISASLAQLVRSLTANREVLGSIPGLVEGWTLGDLLSPDRPWTGMLKAEYQAWRNGSEFAKSLIFIQGVWKSVDCHLKAVASEITKYLCNL